MNRMSLGALAAAGLMAGSFATGASAADLGGNCCADLEERIAELEATTARKGNRKVSLTISGFVAQQIVHWDDGLESNTYITDTGSVSIGTHVAFTGQATIAPGWTAGYVLKIELMNNDSLAISAANSDGGNVFGAIQAGDLAVTNTISLESSYWFIKSEKHGRLSVGHQSSAADNQAILPDGSGSLVQANYVLYDARLLTFTRNGTTRSIPTAVLANCHPAGGGAVAGDCDGYPYESIRYDTPTFAGFSASVSWGADDIWAVSGRYSGEHHGFKFAAAVAYVEAKDETEVLPRVNASTNGGLEASAWQAGAYIEHVATGLFLYGAYSEDKADVSASERGNGLNTPDGEQWYLKAGIRQRWLPLGHTVLYGEYGENNDRFTASTLGSGNSGNVDLDLYSAGVNSTELRQYGIGIVQEIDAAAMSVWLAWRHYEADVTCNDADAVGLNAMGAARSCADFGLLSSSNQGFDDIDLIKAGALINF